ncbi:hypothetical protein ACLI1C_15980 [Devosia sp. XGJD_8]|uniref:hypothetical protein n=1 Tax=Devosia sp. XGJD_8 TaxID=3391187 RepID=UPI00398541C8
MKLQRDAKVLKSHAISSLRLAMEAFNSYSEEGRIVCVLLHLQHACEMLLKAALCQNRIRVFDKSTGRSIGFEKCLSLCTALKLSPVDAGVMRSVDALRDSAQHWYVAISEELLYLQTRALITSFDAYLKAVFTDDLSSHIPARVLPVSTQPPGDFEFLVDREYKLVSDLLSPGKRQRGEARAKIRSLLAMEALVTDQVSVSEKDVDRVEKAVREGLDLGSVFPRLLSVDTSSSGEGVSLKIVLGKKDGAPMKYVGGDDVENVAAVREVDLSKKYHLRASELSARLGLSEPRCRALRTELKIDEDASCSHLFESLSSWYVGYSDNAVRRMKESIAGGIDLTAVWERHRPRPKRGVKNRQGKD